MAQIANPFVASRASQEQITEQPRLMDKTWEVIQKKTFTNWINNKLALKEVAPLKNIETDLADGVKLIQLLEIIGDEPLGKYNKNPKMRIQKVENMNTALAFIKRRGVGLTNIGAEDVVDSNVKLVLGLIWSIILRFTIADISEGGLTAKEGLLLWVQKRTVPYKADFYVQDFTYSWQSGLALCALIHRHRPDLLNYWALDKSNAKANTHLAFETAEQHLGIPKLFAVEDICDVAKPDERSVMTYVAQYFHVFSEMDKSANAGRRVGKFGQAMSSIWNMQNDYERRVRKLIGDMGAIQQTWVGSFTNYPQAKKCLLEFENYKSTSKRGWVVEKRDLDTLFGNIQTKLITYELPPYVPAAGCTPNDLENAWSSHVTAEAKRKMSISSYIKEIKEVLKNEYAQAANSYQKELNQISLCISKLGGELDSQLATVKGLMGSLSSLTQNLGAVEQLSKQCDEANIEDNEYTIYSLEDLKFELNILSQSLQKTQDFIENQKVARTMGNKMTSQQLDSYTETFKFFDKDQTNSLSKEEFKAALQAEGFSTTDSECDGLFTTSASKLSFEKFIEFIKDFAEDKTTPEQLEVSFAALALDKDYITEKDMQMGGLPVQVTEYFKQVMPRKNDGFEYKEYLSSVFRR